MASFVSETEASTYSNDNLPSDLHDYFLPTFGGQPKLAPNPSVSERTIFSYREMMEMNDFKI